MDIKPGVTVKYLKQHMFDKDLPEEMIKTLDKIARLDGEDLTTFKFGSARLNMAGERAGYQQLPMIRQLQ